MEKPPVASGDDHTEAEKRVWQGSCEKELLSGFGGAALPKPQDD